MGTVNSTVTGVVAGVTPHPISALVSGPRNGRWRGGKTLTWRGHVRITAGEWRGVYEHVQVYLQEHSLLYLPLGWEVHHLDGVPWHNAPGNLKLMLKSEHATETNKRRWGGQVRVTAMDLTEKDWQELVERGVGVPDGILQALNWWIDKYGEGIPEVPF